MTDVGQSQTDQSPSQPPAAEITPAGASSGRRHVFSLFNRSHRDGAIGANTKISPKRSLPSKTWLPILSVVVLVGGYAAYSIYRHSTVPVDTRVNQELLLENQALQKNDKSAALADAQKALADDPHNVNANLSMAYLEEAQNPKAATQYFAQAYTELEKQQSGASGLTAANYWAAAQLAEQAGEKSQAQQNYKMVIQTAKPNNLYEQSLAQKSQTALERLQ